MMEDQSDKNLIQIPNCPLCLEKVDMSVIGFDFKKIDKLFIYDIKDRWMEIKQGCRACCQYSLLEKACSKCEQREDLWICLICGNQACGRYKDKHAVEHQKTTNHVFSMEITTGRIWDYIGDSFVHRIMQSEDHMIVNLPDQQNIQEQQLEKKKDGIEKINENICQQMEQQRNHYTDRIQKIEKNHDQKMKQKLEKLQLVKQQLASIQKQKEEQKKEIESTKKKNKILCDKNNQMEQQIEQLEMFNESIQSNIAILEQNNKLKQFKDEDLDQDRKKLAQLQEKLQEMYQQLD